jgi:hypothetical protein
MLLKQQTQFRRHGVLAGMKADSGAAGKPATEESPKRKPLHIEAALEEKSLETVRAYSKWMEEAREWGKILRQKQAAELAAAELAQLLLAERALLG